jgi:hypothetical protein
MNNYCIGIHIFLNSYYTALGNPINQIDFYWIINYNKYNNINNNNSTNLYTC